MFDADETAVFVDDVLRRQPHPPPFPMARGFVHTSHVGAALAAESAASTTPVNFNHHDTSTELPQLSLPPFTPSAIASRGGVPSQARALVELARVENALRQMYADKLRSSAHAIVGALANELPRDHVFAQLMADASTAQFCRVRVGEVVETFLFSVQAHQYHTLAAELARREADTAQLAAEVDALRASLDEATKALAAAPASPPPGDSVASRLPSVAAAATQVAMTPPRAREAEQEATLAVAAASFVDGVSERVCAHFSAISGDLSRNLLDSMRASAQESAAAAAELHARLADAERRAAQADACAAVADLRAAAAEVRVVELESELLRQRTAIDELAARDSLAATAAAVRDEHTAISAASAHIVRALVDRLCASEAAVCEAVRESANCAARTIESAFDEYRAVGNANVSAAATAAVESVVGAARLMDVAAFPAAIADNLACSVSRAAADAVATELRSAAPPVVVAPPPVVVVRKDAEVQAAVIAIETAVAHASVSAVPRTAAVGMQTDDDDHDGGGVEESAFVPVPPVSHIAELSVLAALASACPPAEQLRTLVAGIARVAAGGADDDADVISAVDRIASAVSASVAELERGAKDRLAEVATLRERLAGAESRAAALDAALSAGRRDDVSPELVSQVESAIMQVSDAVRAQLATLGDRLMQAHDASCAASAAGRAEVAQEQLAAHERALASAVSDIRSAMESAVATAAETAAEHTRAAATVVPPAAVYDAASVDAAVARAVLALRELHAAAAASADAAESASGTLVAELREELASSQRAAEAALAEAASVRVAALNAVAVLRSAITAAAAVDPDNDSATPAETGGDDDSLGAVARKAAHELQRLCTALAVATSELRDAKCATMRAEAAAEAAVANSTDDSRTANRAAQRAAAAFRVAVAAVVGMPAHCDADGDHEHDEAAEADDLATQRRWLSALESHVARVASAQRDGEAALRAALAEAQRQAASAATAAAAAAADAAATNAQAAAERAAAAAAAEEHRASAAAAAARSPSRIASANTSVLTSDRGVEAAAAAAEQLRASELQLAALREQVAQLTRDLAASREAASVAAALLQAERESATAAALRAAELAARGAAEVEELRGRLASTARQLQAEERRNGELHERCITKERENARLAALQHHQPQQFSSPPQFAPSPISAAAAVSVASPAPAPPAAFGVYHFHHNASRSASAASQPPRRDTIFGAAAEKLLRGQSRSESLGMSPSAPPGDGNELAAWD